ncbi:MAG TPA: bifunctional diguanylate cyclase/phosphodiesterase [Frateuria sp.]|uniref:EAL domain-containing protein n=1 Tax=Frateuria sp. TaxID=2211372 RepID=UPI002DF647D3|nr:bifunctional diguanylate cyclase/phosphodiesterase [Frateuria sp.]
MVERGTRWARSLLLASPCALLYWVNIPYRAGFFGIRVDASLVHLHFGYLLALAMLHRDRLPLRLGVLAMACMWLAAAHAGHPPPTIYLFGVCSAAGTYGLLRLAARRMGWPRAGRPFGVADVSGFVLYGLVLLPLAMAVGNLLLEAALAWPVPDWRLLANDQLQVLFAELFGVLVLALPMLVLATHANGRALWWRGVPWRLLAVGVLLPLGLLQWAPRLGLHPDLLPGMLLHNRLLIAAALVWAALRLRLRWSMPLLVLAQLLFAVGLARHASETVRLPDVFGLLRTALECAVLQLLVVLLMLYGNEREAASIRHERDSLTDPFTGLPNLAALRRRCAPEPPALGLLLLDRTEKITACLGLIAQAALMRWVAGRLRGVAQVYCIGTGQLVLASADPHGTVDWDQALERLHRCDFTWDGQRVRVLPYLGVVAAGDSLDERLQAASRAAIEAKQRGEMRWLRAEQETGGGGDARLSRQRGLSLSSVVFSRIRAGEVELWFQPIAPLAAGLSRSLSGEVLCRLRDDAGRLLLPGQFMPELQEDGRMAELDLAVLRRLGRWMDEQRARLPSIGYLSINIAGQSLASREFAVELLALVDGLALPARQLCFEITETAAITHVQDSARLFAQLRERGCHLAIDDFGMGFQSFDRLKQIPADLIKIDGSFVRDMRRSPRDLELVRASVQVARAFGAQTAAEFVEDAVTAELLRGLQVDWMQGDHVGRAAPIERMLRHDACAFHRVGDGV